jgi:hypothetical protein
MSAVAPSMCDETQFFVIARSPCDEVIQSLLGQTGLLRFARNDGVLIRYGELARRRFGRTSLRDQPLQFGNARAAIGAGLQLCADLGG